VLQKIIEVQEIQSIREGSDVKDFFSVIRGRVFFLAVIFVMFCSVFSTYVFSQVVQYKTGEVITGTIVESTDKYLVVDSTIGKIFIPLDQVRSVVFDDTENFPTNGSEISINGRKYTGYFKDLKDGVMTVSTWFGKIVVHSFQTLDYVGFEQKDFPANQSVGLFRMELSSSENYVCVLYTGDVFIGKDIYSSDPFLVVVDQHGNEFYIEKILIEDIYIPYKYASGYDLVVSKDGKRVYGKVSIDSFGMMQISGSWGNTTVEASNVVFTTFDSTKTKGLDSLLNQLEYDKAAVAVLATATPLTVDGKEVNTIKIYPKEITDPRTGITFVFVPGGTFFMGASKDWKGADEDELPMRQVYVSGFYISKYPITTKQYLDFLRAAQASNVALGNHIDTVEIQFLKTKLIAGYTADEKFYNIPITGINWNSAKEYCNWAGYQLPTEAQWEKAARGKDGRMYPWGNEILSGGFNDGKKEYSVYSFEKTDVSPYGVVNMYGLPMEFCRDYYDKSAYKKLPAENPFNASGTLVVGRSGAVAGRITDRISVDPKEKRNDFTFRVVIDADNAMDVVKKPLNNKAFGVTWFVVNDSVKQTYKVKSDGLYVAYVEKNSPAEVAGLKVGDIIVSVDGKIVKTIDDVAKSIVGKATVTITVDRSGKKIDLKLTPGEWKF